MTKIILLALSLSPLALAGCAGWACNEGRYAKPGQPSSCCNEPAKVQPSTTPGPETGNASQPSTTSVKPPGPEAGNASQPAH
jgi:hypothetical protein